MYPYGQLLRKRHNPYKAAAAIRRIDRWNELHELRRAFDTLSGVRYTYLDIADVPETEAEVRAEIESLRLRVAALREGKIPAPAKDLNGFAADPE